jgi:hypothetical protein
MPLPTRSKSRASHDVQDVRLAIGDGQPRSMGGGASVAYPWRDGSQCETQYGMSLRMR